MSFKKVLLTLSAVACAAAFTSTAMARDLLRVGTEPTFAPFEFLDTKKNEFTGFDIDLIKAIADKAGYDVEIMNMGFDALIPALTGSTIDVIAAGISITPEREQRVAFTTPYYTSGLSFWIRAENAEKYPDFASLKNTHIAAQIGTTGAEYARHHIEGATVSNFNTTSEAFMDLTSRNCAAVVMDRPVLAYFLKTKPRLAKNFKLSTEIAEAQSFGFAVRKDTTELLKKLNDAFAELKASGEFDKIHSKWFAE